MGQKLGRPSLKNYLSTGKVVVEEIELDDKKSTKEVAKATAKVKSKNDDKQAAPIKTETTSKTVKEETNGTQKAKVDKSAKADKPTKETEIKANEVTEVVKAAQVAKNAKTGKAKKAKVKDAEQTGAEYYEKLSALLSVMSPEDIETWENIFTLGAKLKEENIDLVQLRDMFREMDRVRFTLYLLEAEGVPLRTVRSGVQIREPFLFVFLWDDEGVVTLYKINKNSEI